MAEPDRPRIALVEDDAVIREATATSLERHGFEVAPAGDGLAALALLEASPPDLVLLDVMLPELDGISVCRRLREHSDVPVIMLSARTDALDVVTGLEAGADDYVTKPFDGQVLLARVRAALRRGATGTASGTDGHAVQTVGGLEIDRDALTVSRDGRPVPLTPTEMRLLLRLAERPGTVHSRSSLLQSVWDYAWDGDHRVVDAHVQRLRAKVGAEAVETVRGFGYRLPS